MFDIVQVPKERLNVAMSYVSSYYHYVFGTKDCRPLITQEFIGNQEDHHRKMTSQEEFLALLEKHRIEYDPKCLWK